MFAEATLIGRAKETPKISLTKEGKQVANLYVATSEKRKNNEGEVQQITQWHSVVIFNQNIIDYTLKYITKGTLLKVRGALKESIYVNKDGVEISKKQIHITNFEGRVWLLPSLTNSQKDNNNDNKGNIADDYNDDLDF